jgi:hypothetical protein
MLTVTIALSNFLAATTLNVLVPAANSPHSSIKYYTDIHHKPHPECTISPKVQGMRKKLSHNAQKRLTGKRYASDDVPILLSHAGHPCNRGKFKITKEMSALLSYVVRKYAAKGWVCREVCWMGN